MKTITVIEGGWVFRWAGGSFIAAWTTERADEHVPDDMIPLPESLKKNHVTKEDIGSVARSYVSALAKRQVVLVELSTQDPKFGELVDARHRRYRRSTTGGIQDEILDLWQDLRDLRLTIAEVVPVTRENAE